MSDSELTVDAQGLACPIPVIRVKKALDGISRGRVVVLLDDPVAKENVSRLAAHLGCSSRCESAAGGFRLIIEKPGKSGAQP
ncbi:MAG: sulfurtransferase TusA family protein [Phycisphaerae bacterium]|nr:sulfurtransferase TusA family protein [Phycisphaerae bacterium]